MNHEAKKRSSFTNEAINYLLEEHGKGKIEM